MGQILVGGATCSECKGPADLDEGGGPYHAMVFCQQCGHTDLAGACGEGTCSHEDQMEGACGSCGGTEDDGYEGCEFAGHGVYVPGPGGAGEYGCPRLTGTF